MRSVRSAALMQCITCPSNATSSGCWSPSACCPWASCCPSTSLETCWKTTRTASDGRPSQTWPPSEKGEV
ncbi:hypothetical protein FKM82_019930 [Ascaphus truei]